MRNDSRRNGRETEMNIGSPGSLQRIAQQHICVKKLIEQRDVLMADVAYMQKMEIKLRTEIKELKKKLGQCPPYARCWSDGERVQKVSAEHVKGYLHCYAVPIADYDQLMITLSGRTVSCEKCNERK
jgi:hypothetical protein